MFYTVFIAIFVLGTIPDTRETGLRFFGIRYVWMDYSQSTASAALRHTPERPCKESKFYCFGGIETMASRDIIVANLHSTASAVLRLSSNSMRASDTTNLSSTASAVLRPLVISSSFSLLWGV